jgi:enoyl-CoA hydratase/carnithine racemase
MFSAGLDVPALLELDREGVRDTWKSFHYLLRSIAFSPVPTVAAITGHAPAGGAVLSLFADYRVMADGPYKIGLNEVEVGIILPRFMFRALERLVGPHQAENLATAATMVKAVEAQRIGLVDEIVAENEVVERALARCERLLSLPPRAMTETRASARRDLQSLLESAGEGYLDDLVELWYSDETQAALAALMSRLRKT